METRVPVGFEDMVAPMRAAHQRIVEALGEGPATQGSLDISGCAAGVAAARAYPIQGILKYHGMADWEWRTAYMPSISVNNDAACTVTLVEFDTKLDEDRVTIGGQEAVGRERQRVQRVLDAVRELAHVPSRAWVVSRNIVRASKVGKGLGTSASASAALAAAALAAACGDEVAGDRRLLSCVARLLAGSGGRSAAGGVALWLSYPGIAHEESYSVRLDAAGEMDDVRLITVPVDSRLGLKTEAAHDDAPQSSLFKCWMQGRCDEVLELVAAVRAGDWRTLGQLAELDSIRLHGVTMSGSRENKLFAWEPENIALFRMCNTLRSEGVPVYFSTDTGPTTVFITHKDHEDAVVDRLASLEMAPEVVRGRIAGPATLLDPDAARMELGI
jgi:diphosphomevalonate decarboxylase